MRSLRQSMRISKPLLGFLAAAAGLFSFVACSATPASETAPENIEAAQIIKDMAERQSVVVSNAHIKGSLCLAQAGSGARVMDDSRVYLDCELVFVGCVFEDDFSACQTVAQMVAGSKQETRQRLTPVFRRSVSFVGCTFLKNADFGGAIFQDRLVLNKSVFRADVSLAGVDAGGGALCNNLSCEGKANLSDARFGRGSSFVALNVRGNAYFQNVRFDDYLMMVDARFGRYVEFSGMRADVLDLSNAGFAGRVECIEGRFAALRLVNCKFADEVTFDGAAFGSQLLLRGAEFEASLSVVRCLFGRATSFADVKHAPQAQLTLSDNSLLAQPYNITNW